MSLEQAITDHASALRELAAAIRSTISGAHEVIADAKKPAAAASSPNGAKPETTEKKAAAPAGEAKKPGLTAGSAATQTAGGTAKAGTATESPSDAPTYADVKDKVLALAQDKGRDTLIALLQRHGVTKAPDLKEAQWVKVIEDVDAIMAGTYDPEAAELA